MTSLLAINWGVDIVTAVGDSDMVGLLCLLILFIISIRTGYFMFAKYWEIKHAKSESELFVEDCLEGHKSLPEIYKAASNYPNSPLAALLREAYVEYETDVRDSTPLNMPIEQRVQLSKTSVESALERTIAAEMRKMESNLVNLATASSLAPFIGLFGTVWGVLGAFQALGREGNANLETLAPGIATALITTIFGLVVAIPATAMYNHLAGNIAHLSSQMDSFAHELSNVFQKHLLRRGAR
jgi:biopolymer transport protein TolQ